MQQPRIAAFALMTTTALVTGMMCSGAQAQGAATYPSRPVNLIMPYTPGSTSDFEARVYQESFPEVFKQPLVIDYKPGASGIIANTAVIKAPPDGYTIAYVPSTLGILPAVRDDVPYEWQKELTPVIQTTRRVFVMAVRRDFPANTYEEYVAYARANPGKVTWSTVGAGGALHMSGEWLAGANKIKLNFIHYKGAAAAELDMLAGRIDSAPKGMVTALPLVKAGKIRVLAIITNKRTSLLPDVRTVEEMGIPGYNYPSWVGLVTGAKVPMDIVNKLHDGMVKVITTPRSMKVWETQGTEVIGASPEEFRKQLLAETELWKRLVKENDIRFKTD